MTRAVGMRSACMRAACAALVLVLVGCSDELPLTEIVVAVDSDLTELTRFRIEIENFGDGDPIDTDVKSLDDLPMSLSLVHDGGPLGPIHLTVTGYSSDDDDDVLIVEPRHDIRFVKDETMLLRVGLWAACQAAACEGATPACVLDDDGAAECLSAEDATDRSLTKWNGSLDGPAGQDKDGGGDDLDGDVREDGGSTLRDGQVGTPDAGMNMPDTGNPDLPAGDYPYTPSNFNPEETSINDLERRSVAFDCGAVTYNSDDDSFTPSCTAMVPVITTVTQTDSSEAKLLVFEDLTIAAGSGLRVVGSRPVILAVFGDADVAGTLDASAVGATPGAGGNQGCTAGVGAAGEEGPGGIVGNFPTAEGGGGGGFGSAGGRGGEGADQAPEQGQGGSTEGAANIVPLRGGCPGGQGGASRGDDPGGSGGAGGGAIQVSVAGELNVSGAISAAGGGGQGGSDREAGGGGGGSGGAVLLEANTLVVDANARITANGGGGGAGHDDDNDNSAAAAGSDGTTTTATAAGGAGQNGAGSGGPGAAADGAAGAGAHGTARSNAALVDVPGDGGGGGGGGIGRLRLRGTATCATPPGVFSPAPAVNCMGCSCGAPPEAFGCTRVGADTHGYFLCDSALSWDAARASCMAAGMELAHVIDDAENAMLDTAATGRADVWLGGHDPDENIWRWSDDGSQFWSGSASGNPTENGGDECSLGDANCNFSAWGSSGANQPDNADPGGGEGDCLSLVPGAGWYDSSCAAGKAYVCEGL